MLRVSVQSSIKLTCSAKWVKTSRKTALTEHKKNSKIVLINECLRIWVCFFPKEFEIFCLKSWLHSYFNQSALHSKRKPNKQTKKKAQMRILGQHYWINGASTIEGLSFCQLVQMQRGMGSWNLLEQTFYPLSGPENLCIRQIQIRNDLSS